MQTRQMKSDAKGENEEELRAEDEERLQVGSRAMQAVAAFGNLQEVVTTFKVSG
jgi:hypothetical protein